MLAATLSGCVAQTDDAGHGSEAVVASDSGWLIVNFTIDGSSDPEQCDKLGASVIGVKVAATDGTPTGEFQQTCPAFYSTIALSPGTYSASVALLDSEGGSRTSSVALQGLEIVGGSPLEIPLDFPTHALYEPRDAF